MKSICQFSEICGVILQVGFRACGQFPLPILVSNKVRQGCLIFSFLSDFAIGNVLQSALSSHLDGGVGLLQGKIIICSEYADDVALLDNLMRVKPAWRLRYLYSARPLHFQNIIHLFKTGSSPCLHPTFYGDWLQVVYSLEYLNCLITPDGGVGEETMNCKARAAFTNL